MAEDEAEQRVWPSPTGTVRGYAVEPLHPSLPALAAGDPELHALFALIDIVRVGAARERKVAAEEIERRLA